MERGAEEKLQFTSLTVQLVQHFCRHWKASVEEKKRRKRSLINDDTGQSKGTSYSHRLAEGRAGH